MTVTPDEARAALAALGRQGITNPNPDQLAAAINTGLDAAEQDRLRSLHQAQRGLAAESSPPGEEPSLPLGEDVMGAAYKAQGGRARPQGGMGPRAVDAGLDRLMERAKAGDPAAVYKQPGEDWHAAKQRYDAGR
jgi:hypothetical protein